jgi:prepilin-type N-terminal cleavage/methylation domain-containing protein
MGGPFIRHCAAQRLTALAIEDLAMSEDSRSTRVMHPTSECGFSLLEVLVAVALLSVGMLAVGVLSVGIINANRVSKNIAVATVLAQNKMEALYNDGYRSLPSDDSILTEDYDSIIDSVDGIAVKYANFRRVTEIQVGSPAAHMKRITVSVYRRAGQSPVVLTTLVSG